MKLLYLGLWKVEWNCNGEVFMDGENLLTAGIDKLNEMQENLLELEGYKNQLSSSSAEEKRLTASKKDLEKSMEEEVLATVKKRRKEIEDTFEGQIDKVKAKIKKSKDKRDKFKNAKVSERIALETAPLKDDNKKLKQEAKNIFRLKHLPSVFNTKIFFALYFPKHITDIMLIMGILLITLLAIPCAIYFFLLPEQRISYLIIIYLISAAIYFAIYVAISNLVKDKHMEELAQVRAIKDNIRVNKKKIHGIRYSIKKDKDESRYGLEELDENLANLDKEIADILEQKKEALSAFDSSTSHVISESIRAPYNEKISAISEEHDKAFKSSADMEEKVKALTLKIANEYEPYIGKDLMNIENLNTFSNIIKAGNASTISEAIAYYKKGMEEAGIK